MYSVFTAARQAVRLARLPSRVMISWLNGTDAAEIPLKVFVTSSKFSGGPALTGGAAAACGNAAAELTAVDPVAASCESACPRANVERRIVVRGVRRSIACWCSSSLSWIQWSMSPRVPNNWEQHHRLAAYTRRSLRVETRQRRADRPGLGVRQLRGPTSAGVRCLPPGPLLPASPRSPRSS